jgi:hypothetical protein
VEGSVQRLAKEPYGFFEFAPQDGLDLDRLDRVLAAAREEVGSVDVAVFPEGAVDEDDIPELEAVLNRHGVVSLLAGIRQRSAEPGQLPANWTHVGMNPRLEKGGVLSNSPGEPWFHIKQNKHNRWSLDESQITQYHLGGVLHPSVRWWEAMHVPRLEVEFIEVAELTLVTLVCEDLARNDGIADLIRSVGPTVVFTLLLDGPQLRSRWSARYASVLADDPGSGVMTLTSYGMVQRSRPIGRDTSAIVALWKDPVRGIREVPLEAGADAVLFTVCMDRATRRTADGRWPVENGTACFDVAVHQVRASTESPAPRHSLAAPAEPLLEVQELTVLTAWAEGVAEVLAYAPERAEALLAEAAEEAPWRAALGVPELSRRLGEALRAMVQAVCGVLRSGDAPAFDALLAGSARRKKVSIRFTILSAGCSGPCSRSAGSDKLKQCQIARAAV